MSGEDAFRGSKRVEIQDVTFDGGQHARRLRTGEIMVVFEDTRDMRAHRRYPPWLKAAGWMPKLVELNRASSWRAGNRRAAEQRIAFPPSHMSARVLEVTS